MLVTRVPPVSYASADKLTETYTVTDKMILSIFLFLILLQGRLQNKGSMRPNFIHVQPHHLFLAHFRWIYFNQIHLIKLKTIETKFSGK